MIKEAPEKTLLAMAYVAHEQNYGTICQLGDHCGCTSPITDSENRKLNKQPNLEQQRLDEPNFASLDARRTKKKEEIQLGSRKRMAP
jgi:hypothetical protein